MKIVEYEAKKGISRSNLPELDYAVNPYSGCQHRCLYCFAINFTSVPEARENWGKVVYAKTNIVKLLKQEINGLRRGIVGISTITDPYQPAEAKYKLTGGTVELLAKNGFRVTIQTKSPLARRDIEIFKRYRNSLDLGVTITTLDRRKAMIIEPQTPSPQERSRLLIDLKEEKIPTWIFLGPIIREFNDNYENLNGIFSLASMTGSRVIYDFYAQYNGSKELMMKEFPGYVPDDAFHGDQSWKSRVTKLIENIAEEHSVKCNSQADEWVASKAQAGQRFL
ncbi:MAG: radical SAM protein [Candidatus Thermoplasmatota archaeon]|nr:radical SAM protein [Candidatus Thermoplasmatota archaeon]MDA8142931.1 radical SAM protein [Thermoplasmatales archaeon]